MASHTSEDIFGYTGEDCHVPKDVVSVRFHSSVIGVPANDHTFKGTGIKEVELNEGLLKICMWAFKDCNSLERIVLPSTVTEIGEHAFCNCNTLKEVVLNEGLKRIGSNTFEECTALESITIPSTLTYINRDAFKGCSNLREVVLNEGLQKIGFGAFGKCASLESITLPSVTKIEGAAFGHCQNMREVVLNEGLQKIGTLSFIGCDALESITLPSTLTDDIETGTFYHCNSLREVALNGNEKIQETAFAMCSSLERFTLPKLSSRLENIIQTGHYQRVEAKIEEVRGTVERRGSDLFVTVTSMINVGRNWNAARQSLHQIIKLIRYYEVKEETTLFELVWKVKMGQVDDINPMNRDAYRIEVPGTVKDTILQYLW